MYLQPSKSALTMDTHGTVNRVTWVTDRHWGDVIHWDAVEVWDDGVEQWDWGTWSFTDQTGGTFQ